ncbi:hypothetical protein HNR39_002651 [Glaciimonas immobilis]|uniref:Uncharacterized protein n=1 Tax=Glaciimonas immobilis TaxID=728004 RepID=A0A840RWL0_9BURK|nr:hypothetical protein [Glaciimonas immobilis]
MKKIIALACILLIYTQSSQAVNFGNAAGGAGAFASGMREGQQRQQKQQCLQSCTPGDGQCYQGCAMAYPEPEQQQNRAPQYSPPPRRIDYTCVSNCAQPGQHYVHQYCESKCSY